MIATTTTAPEILRVGFLTLPNYSMIAYANAVEPLRMLNRLSGETLCVWTTVSLGGEAVHASNGQAVVPTVAVAAAGRLDMVFVCGGVDIAEAYDAATLAYLRRLSRQDVKLGALCTGSYVLARAGLLDGYRCAIHWENIAAVRDEFPTVDFSNEIFVIDRDRYTASGGTAPLDLILNLIADRAGTDLAVAISEGFIHERIRAPLDQQRIPLLARVGAGQQKIIDAASLMEAHVDEPLSLDAVARRIGLSRRHLERLFRRHLDCHPARYYRELRLTRGRQLLLQTNMSVMAITVACGFQSPAHFSTCYKDLFGHPPSAERRSETRAGAPRQAARLSPPL
jgi:AraC family transcriptional regulator, glycine betaine-responsive activator